jgi:hypothetical protein
METFKKWLFNAHDVVENLNASFGWALLKMILYSLNP